MYNWEWGAGTLLLAAALWTDVRKMVIPNALTVGFGCGGILMHGMIGGIHGLAWTGAGLLSGFIPFYILYLFRGIGGGDVKWFGAMGCWIGAASVWQLTLYSVLFAGGLAGLLLLLRLPVLRTIGAKVPWPWSGHPVYGRSVRFPFMLAVAPAFAAIWLAGG